MTIGKHALISDIRLIAGDYSIIFHDFYENLYSPKFNVSHFRWCTYLHNTSQEILYFTVFLLLIDTHYKNCVSLLLFLMIHAAIVSLAEWNYSLDQMPVERVYTSSRYNDNYLIDILSWHLMV